MQDIERYSIWRAGIKVFETNSLEAILKLLNSGDCPEKRFLALPLLDEMVKEAQDNGAW